MLGKRTLLPILTLKLGDKYLSEYIYHIYIQTNTDEIIDWYMSISPVQYIENCPCMKCMDKDLNQTRNILFTNLGMIDDIKFMNYYEPRVKSFESIHMIFHPDFISRTYEINDHEDITFDNYCKRFFNVSNEILINYSSCELLLNRKKYKISLFEKIKIVNNIYQIFNNIKNDFYINKYNEIGDIPYDTIEQEFYDIHEILYYHYLSYKDLENLWEPGIMIDKKNNIYTYRHFNVPRVNHIS
jgi:hypothetical protein